MGPDKRAGRNIQGNTVSPGTTESEMTSNCNQDTINGIISKIPANRLGYPAEADFIKVRR